MRDPSIHITKTKFKELLKELGVKSFPVEDFFVNAKQSAVNTRIMLIKSSKNRKKANNIALASLGDANLAANIFYSVQVSMKFKGVRKIEESQPRLWASCKKLADICNTFCKDFELETRAGYIEYIKTGLNLLKNRNHKSYLNSLLNMSEEISKTYQSKQELLEDSDPGFTKKIHDYYCKTIVNRTGIRVDYTNQPSLYAYFKDVANKCNEDDIDYRDWIDAQFEGLAWCNGMPEPQNLVNDKAYGYYTKFMYKHSEASKEDYISNIEGSLWNKINDEDE
nr:MAG TPA: hypothetical protein [Caudoviricetes sp.]